MSNSLDLDTDREPAIRWQYLYDKKQFFDSTLPGWHSFDEQDALTLEQRRQIYMARSNAPPVTRIKSAISGYEYDVDIQQMTQTNTNTEKVRRLRRLEVKFRRVHVAGGNTLCVDVDVATGESVEWVWEVEGGQNKIDFEAKFVPAGDHPPAAEERLIKATRAALAWTYKASQEGCVKFTWTNLFPMAKERQVLVDWWKGGVAADADVSTEAAAGTEASPDEQDVVCPGEDLQADSSGPTRPRTATVDSLCREPVEHEGPDGKASAPEGGAEPSKAAEVESLPKASAETLQSLKGVLVIDARDTSEIEAGKGGAPIPGSVNVPFNVDGLKQSDRPTTVEEYSAKLQEAGCLPEDKGAAIITHCGAGGRGGKACNVFVSLGYTNVHNGGSPDNIRASGVEI